ncbi:TrbI/VirB10 family protein [Lysobacter sp. N42]|uniref:TrbI/VirB10 family protein n=1 Tax=Lysobacter sp. N42 TaxID=2545719 RepID=UPI00104A154F|nr:TrbI/VirB10 family protein [Lysobacter sp. N42]TCZ87239.1 TrbI/VirB10 family protein [Lysobacter sp. N42]
MNPNAPNPYLPGHEPSAASVQREGYGAEAPQLEDTGPMLRQAEAQRINRKALLFLAGIVGMLVLMALWMFARATDKDADKAIKPPSEVVKIPELPQAAAAEPVPLASTPPYGADAAYAADLAPLPPLPEPEPMPAYAAAPPPPPPPPPGYGMPASAEPRPLSLLERRMGEDTASGRPASPQEAYAQAMLASMQAANPAAAKAEPVKATARDGARYIANPDALLVRGTYIRCVLETRIVTDVPGYTSCIVTEPVYSINGRSLLLPKGSKVLGRYEEGPDGPRVAVVWDRITTPNGIDVSMANPGVDGMGSAGHPGHYDAHWPSRIASALLISLIADGFEYAAAKHGPGTTYATDNLVVEAPFESKTAQSLERVAQQAISAGARRRATLTVNQGVVVNVYVARDIDFSSVVARR